MKHIIYIDPLESLVIKKDSSLLLALTLKKRGEKVFLLFKEDLFFINKKSPFFHLYDFEGSFDKNSYYIESFKLKEKKLLIWSKEDFFHMRLDPPFNDSYLKKLWILKSYESLGFSQILNSAQGLLLTHEKLDAYILETSIPSYVGSKGESLSLFCDDLLKKGIEFVILKPLNMFQGLGVQRFSLNDSDKIQKALDKMEGVGIVQPFCDAVYDGEIRSVFFKGKELGTIKKIPENGSYMANIAQGAKYQKESLSSDLKNKCEKVSEKFLASGISWIAFDILGDAISEINVTCPGLLVEVSKACGKNLADEIIKNL